MGVEDNAKTKGIDLGTGDLKKTVQRLKLKCQFKLVQLNGFARLV